MRRTGSKLYWADRRHWDRPEQSAWIGTDSWVEVMNLGGEIREVILTSVEVQSNEAERPLVDCSVDTHIHAAHEAHVCVEQQCLGASVRVRRGPVPSNIRHTDESVEVSDGRGIDAGSEKAEVECLPTD